MPKYVSLQQYKFSDDGLVSPLPSVPANFTDRTLAMTISRAESDIDDYMGFDLSLGGFEPHMTSIQRPWNEQNLRTLAPNSPVPIRQVTRYRIQVSNQSNTGAGFFANIGTGDCVVNRTQGYVEIVPLQAVTYSLSPVILQLGLKPPLVQMDTEVGYFLPQWGETLINNGDNQTYSSLRAFWCQTYTQALASQPALLPPVPPVMYVNGAVVTSGFTINYNEGSVFFTMPQPSSAVVSADYTYAIPDTVRDATILQTTFLLGQIALNKLGMQGLEFIRSGYQQAKRHLNADATGDRGNLCALAAAKLAQYIEIPVA